MGPGHSRNDVPDHMTSLAAYSGAQDGVDDTPPSPLTPASQGGGPTPVQFQDFEWGLRFSDSSAAARNTGPPDPVDDVLHNIRTATDMHDLRRLIHPEGLCTGFDDVHNVYDTTKKWLREIIFADPIPQAEHLANASAEFSLRYMLPTPHRQAVLALSAKNGWSKEGILQGLLVNMDELEHHSTRIVVCRTVSASCLRC